MIEKVETSLQWMKNMLPSPITMRLFGTPIFFPRSSTQLAFLFVISISGYSIGAVVIQGLLPIYHNIAMPSFEHTQQP